MFEIAYDMNRGVDLRIPVVQVEKLPSLDELLIPLHGDQANNLTIADLSKDSFMSIAFASDQYLVTYFDDDLGNRVLRSNGTLTGQEITLAVGGQPAGWDTDKLVDYDKMKKAIQYFAERSALHPDLIWVED